MAWVLDPNGWLCNADCRFGGAMDSKSCCQEVKELCAALKLPDCRELARVLKSWACCWNHVKLADCAELVAEETLETLILIMIDSLSCPPV